MDYLGQIHTVMLPWNINNIRMNINVLHKAALDVVYLYTKHRQKTPVCHLFLFCYVTCDYKLLGSYSCHGNTVNIFRYSDRQKGRCVCVCWGGVGVGAVDIDSVHKLRTVSGVPSSDGEWNKTNRV